MSALFEMGQLAMPDRTESLLDVLWNTIGASLGVQIGSVRDVRRHARTDAATR